MGGKKLRSRPYSLIYYLGPPAVSVVGQAAKVLAIIERESPLTRQELLSYVEREITTKRKGHRQLLTQALTALRRSAAIKIAIPITIKA